MLFSVVGAGILVLLQSLMFAIIGVEHHGHLCDGHCMSDLRQAVVSQSWCLIMMQSSSVIHNSDEGGMLPVDTLQQDDHQLVGLCSPASASKHGNRVNL
jgi:hypothetical protein